jgi:hypothetical protein
MPIIEEALGRIREAVPECNIQIASQDVGEVL